MATNDRVTQPNTTGQHKKTEPLSQQAIAFTDTLLAKALLLTYLVQIPEFTELWRQARETPGKIMDAIIPRVVDIFVNLSPEARGAVVVGEKAYSLYDRDTLNEAEIAAIKLDRISRAVNEYLEKEGIKPDYQPRLEAIVNPLGVPDLVKLMTFLDMREWGLNQIQTGKIAGPTGDLLESLLIRGLTDLSPMEAASETQATITRRVKRKISPLSRHIKRYALDKRIWLWVRNVVYGERIRDIASGLKDDLQRGEDKGYWREEWVRTQVREATKILEVKRPPGRPQKGGVLRHWKLMAK